MKSVKEQMELARKAQAEVSNYTQEQIDDVCLAVGWEVYEDNNIARLAHMAAEETGYGNAESKIIKHKRKVGGVLHDIRGAKSVGLMERDEATGISKFAKPVGVVCAILPATNPTATCGGKAISILKGRNAVIFKPSSRAVKSTTETVEMMRAGLRKVGAPENLIQILEEPGREGINELMREADLIVATGSGQVVRAAYSSGTPAYGVGQGNAVAIVAEDADVAQAATMICGSKLFDYATSCSSENAAIAVEAVYDAFVAELKKNHCHLVAGEDREKLKNHMWKLNARGKYALNPDIIAKSAAHIARGAGIAIPEGTDILLVEGTEPILDDRFHDENGGARPFLRHPYLEAGLHRLPRGQHEVLAHHRASGHERGQRRAPLQPDALHGHSGLRHLGRQHHYGKRPLAALHQRHLGQRAGGTLVLLRRGNVGRFLEKAREIKRLEKAEGLS